MGATADEATATVEPSQHFDDHDNTASPRIMPERVDVGKASAPRLLCVGSAYRQGGDHQTLLCCSHPSEEDEMRGGIDIPAWLVQFLCGQPAAEKPEAPEHESDYYCHDPFCDDTKMVDSDLAPGEGDATTFVTVVG